MNQRREDMLAEPAVITDSLKMATRKHCKRKGIPIPAWAQTAVYVAPTAPVRGTVSEMADVRAYCRRHGIPIPPWAESKRMQREAVTDEPEEKFNTPLTRHNTREWCNEHGLPVPAWAQYRTKPRAEYVRGVKRNSGRKCKPLYGYNAFTACAVWTEVGLATRYGMDVYWRNAEGIVESLGDTALTDAVKSHAPNAYEMAFEKAKELIPLLAVKTRRAEMREKKATPNRDAAQRQKRAWENFLIESGQIKHSNEIRARFFRFNGKVKGN